jgi:hypothetical protein
LTQTGQLGISVDTTQGGSVSLDTSSPTNTQLIDNTGAKVAIQGSSAKSIEIDSIKNTGGIIQVGGSKGKLILLI